MVLKSYAKINLSLSVNKKLKSGLHDLQSYFSLINLHDIIHIKKTKNGKSDKISFKGPHSKFVNKKNNSIKNILILMRENKLINNYYSVKVFKKIPVFAGFGGGTSNAATIFKFLLKKKQKKKLEKDIFIKLGSDFSLFFYNRGFLNTLRKIIKIDNKIKLSLLLVYPNKKCSTKEIYSRVKTYSKKKYFKDNFQSKSKFLKYILKSKNDLQAIVEKKYPVIQRLLIDINKARGCYLSRMTGSGSACYGIFTDKNCSKVALKLLRKKYPKFWFSIAKTI